LIMGMSNAAVIMVRLTTDAYLSIMRTTSTALWPRLKIALAADTVSIAVMEVIDNAIVLSVPGAMEAGLASWLFWASLAFALAVAFVVTVPVNRWMIGRDKGHAVVHAYHH
jgi:hypothetical protein